MRSIRIKRKFLFIMFALLFISSLRAQMVSIIPRPAEMKILEGNFEIGSNTKLIYDHTNKDLVRIAEFLSKHLEEYYHISLSSAPSNEKSVQFKIIPSSNLNKEGYLMKIDQDGVLITAPSVNGIFYGVQTLKQMLPPQPSSGLNVPFAEIMDQPRFVWRGLMLDVGRHFYPVSYIKKLLDYMAMYKLNTFHWHLTEDQGWRIEIKKHPKLTELAHWRDETIVGHEWDSKTYDGIGYGGFYTQDQIKEIVQYAADRYITIIPEIEMPGHSTAALAAYPALGCTGGPYEVQKSWGAKKDVYCAGKEETFRFLEDVLDEVRNLFPSTYIHVGGDECSKDRWKGCDYCQKRIADENLKDESELQSYFIKRIEKYLNSKNIKLIGWDEILEGGLAPEATVMSWRGIKGGIEAVKQNHDVIMSPSSHCYLDLYQNQNTESEPLAIGGYLPLEKVYSYEPVPDGLSVMESKHILGAQANVWTEYIANTNKLEYMVFPRICALSEVVWSPKASRNFSDFQKRMGTEYLRLKMYNIYYCDHSN